MREHPAKITSVKCISMLYNTGSGIKKRCEKPVAFAPDCIYTGDQRWQIPLTLSAEMNLPDALSEFVPKFETLFLSVKDTEATESIILKGHFTILFRCIRNSISPESLKKRKLKAISTRH